MKLDKTNILMALEEGGYYFPKEFIFTRRDWEDLHETLTSFKKRVLKRRLSVDLDSLDLVKRGLRNEFVDG